jgi:glycosyltransferase involved in cell wall biosynthesis
MKDELVCDFNIPEEKVGVIPFGINNTLPNTGLTTEEARRILGVQNSQKAMLFFGNIAPYKGLDILISALVRVPNIEDYRLIIAGRAKGSELYWKKIKEQIERSNLRACVIEKIQYIPDEQVELYFKAADLLVLPYNHVFQSGVLFLGYSFGLPVVATDVGAMREDIVHGKTGFVCPAQDPGELACAIETYFSSNLFKELEHRRREIRDFANEQYSWEKVASVSGKVYSALVKYRN